MNPNWQDYVTDNSNPNWKGILMKILKCWGHIHDDWYEEYWRKFGISQEEGVKIIREYEKYEQENTK